MTMQITFAKQEKPLITTTLKNIEIKHVGDQVQFIKHYIKDSSQCGDIPISGECNLFRSEVLKYESFTMSKWLVSDGSLLNAYNNYLGWLTIKPYAHEFTRSYFSGDYLTRYNEYIDKKIVFDTKKRLISSKSEKSTESGPPFILVIILIVLFYGIILGTWYDNMNPLRVPLFFAILILGVIYGISIRDTPTYDIELTFVLTGMLVIVFTCFFYESSEVVKFIVNIIGSIVIIAFACFLFIFQFGAGLFMPKVLISTLILSFLVTSFIEGSQPWVIWIKKKFKAWQTNFVEENFYWLN